MRILADHSEIQELQSSNKACLRSCSVALAQKIAEGLLQCMCKHAHPC